MRPILLVAVLLALLQQATAIPYAITLGNVSVQTEIPALRNGFQVEITQHGDSQLPSFSIPLDVAGTSPTLEIYPGPMPTLEEIRQLLGQDVAASDLVALQTGFWPVNGQAGRGGYILHGPKNALGERVLSGQAWIFFEQGPYTCQIIKKLSYYHSEAEIRLALDHFNESLSYLHVQIV
jgi:hypothetical protein